MAQGTLTSADAVLIITCADLFGAPQQITGFSTDDMFSTEPVSTIETQMGVDGNLSAGYVPAAKVMTIMLMADSDGILIFDTIHEKQEANRAAYALSGQVTLVALNRIFIMDRGFLTSYSVMPDARRILQPRRAQITWKAILPMPI